MRGVVLMSGMAEARVVMRRLPSAVTAELRRNALRTGTAIKAGAKSRAPVLTGWTRDHIHMYELPDEKTVVVSAGSDQPRLRISHHYRRSSGRFSHVQSVSINMLPLWLEYGTKFMAPRPFMRPAVEEQRAAYERGVRDGADRAAVSVGFTR